MVESKDSGYYDFLSCPMNIWPNLNLSPLLEVHKNLNGRTSKRVQLDGTYREYHFLHALNTPAEYNASRIVGEALPSSVPPSKPVPALAQIHRLSDPPTTPTDSLELRASRGTLRIACGTMPLHFLTLVYLWSIRRCSSHPVGKR